MQLHRSIQNKVFAGVCGGLAESLGFEAIYIRLIFLLLLLNTGNSLVVYIVLWIVLPQMDYSGQQPAYRLLRLRGDKMIGGVCSGLAVAMNTDPAIVRLAFVGLTLLGGGGIVIYLLLWIVMPLEP
ncbi:MAG: hypothetical protein CVU49_02220 [Candidatus Cloacimonetes bacterium HGW-Cloacimonetes-2]|jgi:phage shock protein PspC (stress-responsive transcriptional regulator)|nr:MAG: hypothetical protein CVU49_02220 [Candidatus Cloacimonetes bacterium HGW-Cloacimonetes-2]